MIFALTHFSWMLLSTMNRRDFTIKVGHTEFPFRSPLKRGPFCDLYYTVKHFAG